jgi:plastocyanin
MRPRKTIVAILSAAALAACGGGGSSGGYMMTPSGGGGGGTTGTSASVTVADYSFSPGSVTIKAGGSVTWTNAGSYAHTTTADGGSWDSGQLATVGGGGGYGGGGSGGAFTKMFSTAGTYTYHCANHSYMTGTVTVTP